MAIFHNVREIQPMSANCHVNGTYVIVRKRYVRYSATRRVPAIYLAIGRRHDAPNDVTEAARNRRERFAAFAKFLC